MSKGTPTRIPTFNERVRDVEDMQDLHTTALGEAFDDLGEHDKAIAAMSLRVRHLEMMLGVALGARNDEVEG